jgi:hypothetical protein
VVLELTPSQSSNDVKEIPQGFSLWSFSFGLIREEFVVML